MIGLILFLAFIYVPTVVGFVSVYQHRVRAAVFALVMTSLWLWVLLSLAT